MYGLIKNKKLIGIHDDETIIMSCLSNTMYKDSYVVKFKKKKRQKIEKSSMYQDLYLVRFGDDYIPFSLYETYKNESLQYSNDLRYCRDILFRLLEDGDISIKDTKSIDKVIHILNNKMNEFNLDIETAENIKKMNEEYRNCINSENT